MGPLFRAMSLMPARMTTTWGFRSITSLRKRASIWTVVCPLIPRSRNPFRSKKSGSTRIQLSVMELPMKTTSGSTVRFLFTWAKARSPAQSR